MVAKEEVVQFVQNALKAIEELKTEKAENAELRKANRELKRELETAQNTINSLQKALNAPAYPECLHSYDDGEGYPPNSCCEKWGIWIDGNEWICDECRGKFPKKQIEKMNR